jgi:hypothetical protein
VVNGLPVIRPAGASTRRPEAQTIGSI